MKIRSVEFAGAIATPTGKAPGVLPQVAFSGRSNVGKSSLINILLGRTRSPIARVSQTPGKTQEINFYQVEAVGENDAELTFFLVDLPGYGFAHAPMAVRAKWAPLIEGFLGKSEELKGVVQLVDARHKPSAEDLKMVRYLSNLAVPTLFVLTKVDKLSNRERAKQVESVIRELGVEPEQVVEFSAKTGEGRDVLVESVGALLQGGSEDG